MTTSAAEITQSAWREQRRPIFDWTTWFPCLQARASTWSGAFRASWGRRELACQRATGRQNHGKCWRRSSARSHLGNIRFHISVLILSVITWGLFSNYAKSADNSRVHVRIVGKIMEPTMSFRRKPESRHAKTSGPTASGGVTAVAQAYLQT
jgi:hypothetical protein